MIVKRHLSDFTLKYFTLAEMAKRLEESLNGFRPGVWVAAVAANMMAAGSLVACYFHHRHRKSGQSLLPSHWVFSFSPFCHFCHSRLITRSSYAHGFHILDSAFLPLMVRASPSNFIPLLHISLHPVHPSDWWSVSQTESLNFTLVQFCKLPIFHSLYMSKPFQCITDWLPLHRWDRRSREDWAGAKHHRKSWISFPWSWPSPPGVPKLYSHCCSCSMSVATLEVMQRDKGIPQLFSWTLNIKVLSILL